MAFKMKGMNFGEDTGSFAKKTAVERMEEQMSKGSGMVDRRREQLGLKPKAEARAERLARKTAKLEGKMEGASDRKKARLQRRIAAKTKRIGTKTKTTEVKTKPTDKVKTKPTDKSKNVKYSDAYTKRGSQYKDYTPEEFKAESKRQMDIYKKTGKWDYQGAKKKTKKRDTDLSKTYIEAPKDDVTDLLRGKSTMTKAAPLKNYKKGYYKKKKK